LLGKWIEEDKPSLAGATKMKTDASSPSEKETPSEIVIERIATNLNEKFKNEADLVKIENIINSVINKIENHVKDELPEETTDQG
jgi:hypothetical protein